MFQIRQVIKRYDTRTVLDIAHLHLEKNTVYALLGPNGSGKTTLLEILALLNRPDSGEVFFDGRPIDYTAGALYTLRRWIVLVQQNPVLFTASVQKNLEFGLKIRGMARQKREKRIDETLDLVDMRAFKDAPAHTLSGGETQRIAIAMGVACFPRVLLLDEPFASVDVENQVAIERIITQIHYEKKIFILFTSHNVEQASRLSRQVISLSRGKPVAGWIHNFYYGRMIETDRGRRRCRVHETLDLFVDSHRTGNVRLSLDPLQIQWIREAPSGMENEFFMTLVQITDEGRQVRLTGDAGVLISLLTPKQEFLTDPPTLGDRIRIRIPERAVRVF